MRVAMDCHGLTHPGRIREANEDQFLVADLTKAMLVRQTSLPADDHTRLFGTPPGHLMAVADGLGGQAGGELASGLAVHTLARYVLDTLPWFLRARDEEGDLADDLRTALEECQRAVEQAAGTDPAHRRMGTTLTLAYVQWPRLYVVHAGDSRAYLLRGGRLHRVTRDHTIAQQLVDRGALTAEQAAESRWNHVIWNCVGGGRHELNPDVHKVTLQPDDRLLLCTDGLTKGVPDGRVAEVLAGSGGAAESAQRLVDEANATGGSDNVTVVVARFHEAAVVT
ncbi:MAG TPA: protein phosphatase 2C domain-containing protein [Gemmataceae bacterium]|jgi:protein phosphatase|nr:protein phosphatase 2C domain-containing protein [Gemmataceae bacterium]